MLAGSTSPEWSSHEIRDAVRVRGFSPVRSFIVPYPLLPTLPVHSQQPSPFVTCAQNRSAIGFAGFIVCR